MKTTCDGETRSPCERKTIRGIYYADDHMLVLGQARRGNSIQMSRRKGSEAPTAYESPTTVSRSSGIPRFDC